MKITAQSMKENNIELTIESSCDNKWDVTIYKDELNDDENREHKRIMSDYLTVEELMTLENMFFKARYLAEQNTEEQK